MFWSPRNNETSMKRLHYLFAQNTQTPISSTIVLQFRIFLKENDRDEHLIRFEHWKCEFETTRNYWNISES